MRLLVIDDSATIRKLAEISFRGSDWTLDFAANGAEGLARAVQGQPQAILLDYVLPDMRAQDVCKRLAADARCAAIPVVLMSAKTELAREDLRRMGHVVGFLPKPFRSEELVGRVNEALESAPPPVTVQRSDSSPAAARGRGGGREAEPASLGSSLRPASRFSFKQKETAAKILYQKLKRHLEALPAWARERGEAPAAPFFARKLFTGEVVEALLEELTPLCQGLPEERPAVPPEVAPASGEPSVLQRDLERLRRPSAWAEADQRVAEPELVYDRVAGFSAKLRQVELSANEQRVLTVVDGRTSLRSIAERTGLALRDVSRIIYRLSEIALVQLRHTFRPSSVVTARVLSILDGDREGVQQPLRALLRRRPEPIEVRDLAVEPDPLAAIKRDRPCLVILNEAGAAGGGPLDIAELARAIRRNEALANTSLAAVLERRSPARIDQLAAAGFDAVWIKPLHFRDVSQLIASSFLAADLVLEAERREPHGKHPHH
jgi:CheY-like chemotaxis protein